MLSGTAKQFDIIWSVAHNAVLLISGRPYTVVGGQWARIDSIEKTGVPASVRVFFNANEMSFSAFKIGGEIFFRLRDLAEYIGFDISWSGADSSIIIDTGAERITYSVAVSHGPGSSSRIIDPSRPVIALTFDDGPAGNTDLMLDILSDYDVPATFFVIGRQIGNRVPTMQRMAKMGHEIGNHTWSHRLLTAISDAQIIEELEDTNSAIEAAVGFRPVLFRAPFGIIDNRVEKVVQGIGHPIIRWSIDTRDWETRNADATYNAIMNYVKHGDIVLSHDIHAPTVKAMQRVIPSLISRGFQLVTVSELMCFSGITLKPGVEYNYGR